MSLIAFHNDKKIKTKYLTRVRAHAKADEIVRGKYWKKGKGCAVGCTIHGSDHKQYETKLGIPEWLARVEDTLFEGMTSVKAKQWPAKFLSAIKPGVDLEKAKAPFLIVVLESSLESMKKAKFDKAKFPDVQKALEGSEAAVKEMIRCHHEGLDLTAAESATESATESAAWSARSAARSAAESAARSAAESAAWSARSAAESATWSAARSTRSAESAAWSAESAARSTGSAESAAYDAFADQLLTILRGIK